MASKWHFNTFCPPPKKAIAGLSTLIVPHDFAAPRGFVRVGELERVECGKLVAGYEFSLTDNTIVAKLLDNPNAGCRHLFNAYRHGSQSDKAVSMRRED